MASFLGIWGEYFGTLTASMPWLNHVAEKYLARKAYEETQIEEEDLKKIEEYIEKHKTSSALKVFTQWTRAIKKAEDYEITLGARQVFQDFHILKATNHFVRVLEQFVVIANRIGGGFRMKVRKVVWNIVPHLRQEIEQAEKWGGEDTKSLMSIMNEAKKRKGNITNNLKNLLKKRRTIPHLEEFPLSMNLKQELNDLNLLENLSLDLEQLDKKLVSDLVSGKESDYNIMLTDFQDILKKAEKDIIEMYKAAHLVMKRDLIMIIMMLDDEKIIQHFDQEWVEKHYMPEKPMDEGLWTITTLREKLANKARIMANGLGVITKKEKEIEKELEMALPKEGHSLKKRSKIKEIKKK